MGACRKALHGDFAPAALAPICLAAFYVRPPQCQHRCYAPVLGSGAKDPRFEMYQEVIICLSVQLLVGNIYLVYEKIGKKFVQ